MKKIAFLFAGALLLAACKSTPQTTGPQTQQQAESEMQDAGKALASGQPVKCTMTKTDGTSMQYVMKDKKMKVSGLTTTVKDQVSQSMMISDGTYMYTWDETKKEGVKFKVPTEQDTKAISEKAGQDVPNLSNDADRKRWEDQGYRINCAAGVVDDSEFIPPTDVKFTDASAMMDSVNKMMKQSDTNAAPTEVDQKAMQERATELMKQYGGNQ